MSRSKGRGPLDRRADRPDRGALRRPDAGTQVSLLLPFANMLEITQTPLITFSITALRR